MTSFRAILEKFRGCRVLVVGDFMLDEYIEGRATRISQEAPVMVIRQNKARALPGGAANVAANVRALGATPSVSGVVGEDLAGERLIAALQDAGLDAGGLVRDSSRPTTRKTRVLADGAHQVLRIDHEETFPLRPEVERLVLEQVTRLLPECHVVLLSDYQKGTLTAQVVTRVIELCNAAGKPVAGNAKPASLEKYRGATLISLNQFEASEAVGREDLLNLAQSRSDKLHSQAMKVASELQKRVGVGHLLVTLRGDGMVTGDFAIEPVRVEVADEAGAGDTTIATVALGLAAVGYCPEIFCLAAETAAAVVQRVGVATPDAGDLQRIAAR